MLNCNMRWKLAWVSAVVLALSGCAHAGSTSLEIDAGALFMTMPVTICSDANPPGSQLDAPVARYDVWAKRDTTVPEGSVAHMAVGRYAGGDTLQILFRIDALTIRGRRYPVDGYAVTNVEDVSRGHEPLHDVSAICYVKGAELRGALRKALKTNGVHSIRR
jgi:hypothetical protein